MPIGSRLDDDGIDDEINDIIDGMTQQQKEETVEENPEERPIQYTLHNGVYVRCGQTNRTLRAGFYKVHDATGYGNYGLKPTSPASDELIDIPGTVADEIFTDIDTFLAVKGDYQSFGLTHKRGYLFWGPPGSGKTSLGMMLARRFIEKVNGIVVYVDDESDLAEAVGIMRDVEPGRPSMYLIEEADRIIDDTECLSILDGEMSIQGAVFVAMTNYKDKLPPRIANRPGRFDRVTFVDCPPAAVQVEYLMRIAARNVERCTGHSHPTAIVKSLEGLPLSMAHLREAFIAHVLMGTPLKSLRKRFEDMARDPNDEADESVDVPATHKLAKRKKKRK